RSTDSGTSWVSIGTSSTYVDQHAIYTPSANVVFLGNDGGIFRSGNTGDTWTDWGAGGMDTTQFYGLCRHPRDTYWAMGGTQDRGSERRRAVDVPPWKHVLGSDGGMCATGPPSGSVIVGEYILLNVTRSADGGASFNDVEENISSSE